MDPDANWEEQQRLLKKIQSNNYDKDDLDRLAELKEALDGWLARGGFPPKRWRHERGPA